MSVELIDNALITQFSDAIHVAAQQIKARMRPYVQIKPMSGEVFAYDGLGPIEASEVIGRQQLVQFADINHLRRKIVRRRFSITLPIDAVDVRGMLTNPQGDYAQACVRAMERVFDRIVVGCLFATVYTGRDFATPVSFATDGGSTVTATGGLTYAKMLAINQNFIDAEVGNDIPEKIVMGIAGNEYTKLMQEVEFISKDFTAEAYVDKGRLQRLVGIDVVQFAGGVANPILAVASSVRSCFAMSTRGVCVGMSKEMGLSIEKRPDLIETVQVQSVFDLGAVRTEGVLVQKVTTTAS